MSIDKALLLDMVEAFIVTYYKGDDIDDLLYLCRVVIQHEPEQNCERHSPLSYWKYIAPNKSLFTNGGGLGLAIGNLPSQLFANFLLNTLDWYLTTVLGFKYVGRYVDDFYIIDTDKQKLLAAVPEIREVLAALGLKLSPKKFYIQHYSKGVEFTGSIIKMTRTYTSNRTVKNFVMAVRRLNAAQTVPEVLHAVDSINSYLGCLRHGNEYATRRRVLKMIDQHCYKWICIKGHFEVVAVKKKYTTRYRTLQRIRDGTY